MAVLIQSCATNACVLDITVHLINALSLLVMIAYFLIRFALQESIDVLSICHSLLHRMSVDPLFVVQNSIEMFLNFI
jgi:hypothetical protein